MPPVLEILVRLMKGDNANEEIEDSPPTGAASEELSGESDGKLSAAEGLDDNPASTNNEPDATAEAAPTRENPVFSENAAGAALNDDDKSGSTEEAASVPSKTAAPKHSIIKEGAPKEGHSMSASASSDFCLPLR